MHPFSSCTAGPIITSPTGFRRVIGVSENFDWTVENPELIFKLGDKLGEGYSSISFLFHSHSIPYPTSLPDSILSFVLLLYTHHKHRSFGVVHKAEYSGYPIAIKLVEVEEGETEAITNEIKILKVCPPLNKQ